MFEKQHRTENVGRKCLSQCSTLREFLMQARLNFIKFTAFSAERRPDSQTWVELNFNYDSDSDNSTISAWIWTTTKSCGAASGRIPGWSHDTAEARKFRFYYERVSISVLLTVNVKKATWMQKVWRCFNWSSHAAAAATAGPFTACVGNTQKENHSTRPAFFWTGEKKQGES